MSFASIKASRQAKSHKSYVQSPNVDQKASATDAAEKVLVTSEALIYQSLPTTTEIRSSSSSGRGIWTKQYIKPGTVILSAKPHAAVLSTQNLKGHCSSCFSASSSGLKKCTQCHLVQYCDAVRPFRSSSISAPSKSREGRLARRMTGLFTRKNALRSKSGPRWHRIQMLLSPAMLSDVSDGFYGGDGRRVQTIHGYELVRYTYLPILILVDRQKRSTTCSPVGRLQDNCQYFTHRLLSR